MISMDFVFARVAGDPFLNCIFIFSINGYDFVLDCAKMADAKGLSVASVGMVVRRHLFREKDWDFFRGLLRG